MQLSECDPREQNGRDSFARYKAQVRSAAIAALSILEEEDTDRVYCDLHDDIVIRKRNSEGYKYLFYQVKTKGKQNYNWSINDLFGINTKLKDLKKQKTESIKNSFVGKLLLHTVVFDEFCNCVVFQTNIHNHDDVISVIDDIESGLFENKHIKLIIERFNECYSDKLNEDLTEVEIKKLINKLKFETDVQFLKNEDHQFEMIAREKIYEYSEIDLERNEIKEILLKLLSLVDKKSSGIIENMTPESIDELAGISIEELLLVLSISKEAYECLLNGVDKKAIKSASIIQRMLDKSGASSDDIGYCSRCKTDWDIWLRKNRHVISEFSLRSIKAGVSKLVSDNIGYRSSIELMKLNQPILDLINSLKENGLLYDLNEDLILGGVFSELVRGRA